MLTSTKTNSQTTGRTFPPSFLRSSCCCILPWKICYACAWVSGKETMLIIWARIAICHAQDYTINDSFILPQSCVCRLFYFILYFLWLFCYMAVENSRIVKKTVSHNSRYSLSFIKPLIPGPLAFLCFNGQFMQWVKCIDVFWQHSTSAFAAQSGWAVCRSTSPLALCQWGTARTYANAPKVTVMWLLQARGRHFVHIYIYTGRFSKAGLLEWMRFVIFCTRSLKRSQRKPGLISE